MSTRSLRHLHMRIVKAALIVALSLALSLILAEGVIRFFAPQVTLFPRYVASDEYAIELPRNARIEHARGRDWRFTYTTNQLGRRGPDVPTGKGVPTVVALGDSFTFGIGVADAEVYTEVLARELGPAFRVVNGGAPGWGIDSQAKWFHTVARAWSPEVVVLQFTANDPSDSVTGVASVQEGALRFKPYDNAKPIWQRVLSGSALIQNSHLYLLTRNVLAPKPRDLAPASADRASPSEQNYCELLEAFSREVHAGGATLLFVSVTHKDPGSGAYVYDLDSFPRIRECVGRLDAGGQLRFVSLPMDAMKEQAVSPEGHQWGAGHHRIVGLELAKQIRPSESR